MKKLLQIYYKICKIKIVTEHSINTDSILVFLSSISIFLTHLTHKIIYIYFLSQLHNIRTLIFTINDYWLRHPFRRSATAVLNRPCLRKSA